MNNTKIDIVLATPPYSLSDNFGILDFAGQYGPPINLLYLASCLENSNYSAKIADLSYDTSGLEKCARRIVSLNPEFVGVAVHFTFLANKSLELISLIKKLNPEIKIIAGGVHFTALPEETMRECPEIDVGILGEAEETLVEVLRGLRDGGKLDGIDGIIFRNRNELHKTEKRNLIEDINKLPFPSFEKIDLSSYSLALYKEKRDAHLSIITSRGCPFACCFCDRTILGRKVRFHSVEYLSEMLDLMVKQLSVNCFDLEDENICITKDRFRDICKLLKEKHNRYDITWGCSMRADSVEADTGKILYDAGCRNVVFGIESGSQKMLDIYNKKLNIKNLPEKCKIIMDAGISLTGSFIIGGPEEDENSISATIDLIKKVDFNFMYLWYFAPYPGSAIYKDIKNSGNLLGDYSNRTGHHIAFIPNTLTRQQLEDAYKRIYRAFYSKPSVMFRTIRSSGFSGIPGIFKKGIKYLQRFILN